MDGQRLCWGAWDWRHASWQGRYYPDDLPQDWRLAYYANDFACLGVPLDAWYPDAVAGAQVLREAAVAGFRCVVEAPPGLEAAGPAREALRALADGLGEHLAAVLVPVEHTHGPARRAALDWAGTLAPALAAAPVDGLPGVWRPEAPCEAVGAVLVARVPIAALPDLATVRGVVEQVLAAAGERPAVLLVEEAPAAAGQAPATERLRELGIIAQLLGVT
ncbi:hypothetical protein HUS23_03305 [Ectothiorhodospiraceae bacterium 2226]|nr:hypothetical protein HUS23_03305 [Ectothiorhodospiraceae bacterium 2226]